jgi:hypothetical protein
MGSAVRRRKCAGLCGGSRCIFHRWAGGNPWASTSTHCIVEEERRRDAPISCLAQLLHTCCGGVATILCGWLGWAHYKSCTARSWGLWFWRRAGGALLDATMSFPFCWWFALLSYFLSFCHNLLCFIQVHTWKWKECMYMCMYVRRLIIMSNKSYDLLLYSAVVCSIILHIQTVFRGVALLQLKPNALHCTAGSLILQ